MRTRSFSLIASVALLVPLCMSTSAVAADSSALAVVAPEVLSNAAQPDQSTTEVMRYTSNKNETTIPTNPAQQLEVDGGAETIGITLPFADKADRGKINDNGQLEYDNNNGSSTVPVSKQDGSLQIATIITSDRAPEEYEYDLSLPTGSQLEIASDGGAVISSAQGEFIGAFLPPWAKDARGVKIPTHYQIEEGNLVQVVSHRDLDGLTYPAVADPWLGIDLISRVNWSGNRAARTEIASIHVTPWLGTVWATSLGGPAAVDNAGWSELLTKTGSRINWVTYRQQWACHAYLAPFAGGLGSGTNTTYDLEYRRGVVGDPITGAPRHQCNW